MLNIPYTAEGYRGNEIQDAHHTHLIGTFITPSNLDLWAPHWSFHSPNKPQGSTGGFLEVSHLCPVSHHHLHHVVQLTSPRFLHLVPPECSARCCPLTGLSTCSTHLTPSPPGLTSISSTCVAYPEGCSRCWTQQQVPNLVERKEGNQETV